MATGTAPMIIHVLGVPMDLGSGRRGVDMGPSAIRIAGLADRLAELGHKVVDEGDVGIKNMEALKVGDVRARYLGGDRPRVPAGVQQGGAHRRQGALPPGARRRPLDLGGNRLRDRHRRRGGKGRRSASSGWTPTATSTRRRPRRRGTSTACRSPRCWAKVRRS